MSTLSPGVIKTPGAHMEPRPPLSASKWPYIAPTPTAGLGRSPSRLGYQASGGCVVSQGHSYTEISRGPTGALQERSWQGSVGEKEQLRGAQALETEGEGQAHTAAHGGGPRHTWISRWGERVGGATSTRLGSRDAAGGGRGERR